MVKNHKGVAPVPRSSKDGKPNIVPTIPVIIVWDRCYYFGKVEVARILLMAWSRIPLRRIRGL